MNNGQNVKYTSHIWGSGRCVGGSYKVAIKKDRKVRQVGCSNFMTFHILRGQNDEGKKTKIRQNGCWVRQVDSASSPCFQQQIEYLTTEALGVFEMNWH